MFDDKRSKKIVLVAHCIMNQNSISDATADFPSQFREIVDLLMENDIGIIQLPCPELACLGLDRSDPEGGTRPLLEENTRIRDLMSKERNLGILRRKAEEIARDAAQYRSHGFQVIGILGINRSPSCGVETTTAGDAEVEGSGIFMEALKAAFHEGGFSIPMIGVKTGEPEISIKKISDFLDGGRERD